MNLNIQNRWQVLASKRVETLILVISSCYSVILGLDSNYDLVDYHLANGWSWIHQQPASNLLTGAASYHAKWLDALYYISISSVPIFLHKAIWGLIPGITLIYLIRISEQIYPKARQKLFSRNAEIMLVCGVAMLNPIVLSEIGTGLQDLTLAMISLIMLHSLIQSNPTRKQELLVIVGSVIVALTKPSMAPYSLILIIFTFTKSQVKKRIVNIILILSTLFLLSGTYIASLRYLKTPNVLIKFPHQIINPELDWADTRFKPKNLLDFIKRFFIPGGIPQVNIEPRYLDLIFPVASLVVGFGIFYLLINKRFSATFHRPQKIVLTYAILGFSIQCLAVGNIRYAIPSLILWPIIALLIFKKLTPSLGQSFLVVMLLLCIFNIIRPTNIYIPTLGFKEVPKSIEWGRTITFSEQAPPFALRSGDMILFTEPTTSHFVTMWNPDPRKVQLLGIYAPEMQSARLKNAIRTKIAATSGNIYTIIQSQNENMIRNRIAIFGLRIQVCEIANSSFKNQWGVWKECKLVKT